MSTSRCLPSLADGSRGTDSPSFIGTMEALRLPSSFSLPSVSLGFNTAALLPCFFVRGGKQIPRNAWTVVHRSALHRSFARRREALLPKGIPAGQVPVEACCTCALVLDPGRNWTSSPISAVRFLLPYRGRTKVPTTMGISGLDHTAFVLPVYASCQLLS